MHRCTKCSPARAQCHRGTNCSGAATRMYVPSPGKFILLLAEPHAETQVATKIPNGKEKPQYQFVYLSQTSAHKLTSDTVLLGNFPRCTHASCPQPPPEAQGKGGPGGAGGPRSWSVLAARCGTPATWPPAPRHRHRSITVPFAGLSQRRKRREAGRRQLF